MKIAIIGPTSQLGSDLHIQLPAAKPIFKSHLDLRNPGLVQERLGSECYDYVINCAALTQLNYCEETPAEAWAIHESSTRAIAEHCALSGAALIQFSCVTVFDGASAEPYDTTASPNPRTVLGGSKLAGELAVAETLPAYRYRIIRTGALFGLAPHRNNWIDQLITAGIKKGKVALHANRIFSPTSTRSVAAAVARILKGNGLEEGAPVVHAACAGGLISHIDAATWLFAQTPYLKHVQVETVKERPRGPQGPSMAALHPSPGWELADWQTEAAEYLLQKGYLRPPCVLEVEEDADQAVTKAWEKLRPTPRDLPEMVRLLREDRQNWLGGLSSKPKRKSLADILGVKT